MGPKKNKKKVDDDQQFQKQQKKMAQLLKKVEKQSKYQPEQQQKKSFDYDFSNEKMILIQQEKQQKNKPKKPVIKLTKQQQADLQKKLAKQKIEKQKKEKKKQQKKDERLKQIEELKQIENLKKQQQEKLAQQVDKQVNSPKVSGKAIPLFFLGFIIVLSLLQYQKQLYTRLSKFQLEGEENFYQTFQVDSGATDRQLKEKYKRLVLKYHPDKNTNCQDCEQKFNKIITAWEVLGNPEKRKHYDANSGYVTQIKSSSITLTPDNYERLIYESKSLWIIQVYDSTQKYCHYFSQFWQDVVGQYDRYIKFGRVDIWTQTDMASYLPYRFQVFPSLYFYHKGEVDICEFDFQQPDWSIRRCIESQYKENLVKNIQSISEIESSDKPSIIFNSQIKLGSRFKIINKKYESDFNFYYINSPPVKGMKEEIKCINSKKYIKNQQDAVFKLSQKDATFYQKYEKFLQSQIWQQISTCELIELCEQQQCFVLTQKHQNLKNITIPVQDSQKLKPIFSIKDNDFYLALEMLKNKTDLHQNFQIGLYQNGHIDLGYMDESDILQVEQGQSFQELKCIHRDNSLTGKLVSLIKGILQ